MSKNVSVSTRFSLEGWNFKKWVVGNKEAIKIVVGAFVTLTALYPALAPYFAAGAVGSILVKAGLDIIDFWSNEVVL